MKIKIGFLLFVIVLGLNSNAQISYEISGAYYDINSSLVNFDTYEGKVLLIDGFRTTCSFCQNNHANLGEVFSVFTDTISMLSLEISGEQDIIQKLEEWKSTYGSLWDIGYDNDFAFKDAFGITGTPTILLFDRNGRVLNTWIGETPATEMIASIQDAIKNKTVTPSSTITNTQPSILEGIFTSPFFWMPVILILILVIYLKFS